jgi:hypothetical protein
MKTLIIFPLIIACFATNAQTAHLQKTEDGDVIYFSVDREVDIRNYVVEGANDSINFVVIATLSSQGNTVHPRTYLYENTDARYANYLVKQIDYNGSCVSSEYIFTPKTPEAPAVPQRREVSSR